MQDWRMQDFQRRLCAPSKAVSLTDCRSHILIFFFISGIIYSARTVDYMTDKRRHDNELSIRHPRKKTRQQNTRKPSCRWQTRATLEKSLHGLRKSSGVVSYIARLPIDSVPMVSYYVLNSNCVCKMRCFGDTRLLKLTWPWNLGQGSLRVIESDTIR